MLIKMARWGGVTITRNEKPRNPVPEMVWMLRWIDNQKSLPVDEQMNMPTFLLDRYMFLSSRQFGTCVRFLSHIVEHAMTMKLVKAPDVELIHTRDLHVTRRGHKFIAKHGDGVCADCGGLGLRGCRCSVCIESIVEGNGYGGGRTSLMPCRECEGTGAKT